MAAVNLTIESSDTDNIQYSKSVSGEDNWVGESSSAKETTAHVFAHAGCLPQKGFLVSNRLTVEGRCGYSTVYGTVVDQ